MVNDYTEISNPYDAKLARQVVGLSVVAGGTTEDSGVTQSSQTTAQAGGVSAASSNVTGGPTQQASVASGGALADIVINNAIQSANWAPRASGFKIDGQTGYAEFINVFIKGNVNATTGTIGGWTINATTITGGDATLNSTGVITLGTGDNIVSLSAVDATYRLWIGNATAASAPFSVTQAGAATMSNVSITGGSITGSGMVAVVALNLANRGWTQTCAFTVANATTVSWGSGTFVTADGGTTLTISAGSTSSMSAKTYIYLDAATSLTAYQVTTTATAAVGSSKVLIAIAQNGTVEATFQVMDGQGGQNIDASSIVANSITANELSSSIVYAGSIQIDTGGNIRSGQTAYNIGSGWFIGYSSGASKLSIGDPNGNYLTWDGTYLRLKGSFDVGTGGIINNASYTVANLPVVPTSVGFNVPSAYE